MNETRRSVIAAVFAGSTVGLAGCTDGDIVGGIGGGSDTGDDGEEDAVSDDTEAADDGANGGDSPPTADVPIHLEYNVEQLRDGSLSGGVGKDGIPSIDAPKFESISDTARSDESPVFGVVRDGEAKAYPQSILVWHEIVNDAIADDPVSVTYCPLTGTAQGFERGGTEFGVSGHLVNSNLIMYDRSTDSWYPQVTATGIDGPMQGKPLREFRVVWTTLGEWREEYPDSALLTDDTGHARRYGSDPYGQYAPIGGYYESDGTMFETLEPIPEGHAKSVVLGARTTDGAIAFDKESLLAERVLTGSVPDDGGTPVVAVADPALSTGYVYRNPDDLRVELDGDAYVVEDGDGAENGFLAPDLPLERILAFDAMWFAWYGFYPSTAFVGEHTGAGDGR